MRRIILSTLLLMWLSGPSMANSGPVGWLLVDPADIWGQPRIQALASIQDDMVFALTRHELSTEDDVWLTTQVQFSFGNDELVDFDILLWAEFEEDRFVALTISYISTQVTMSDVEFLWATLIGLASNHFQAPLEFTVVTPNNDIDESAHVPFGNDFEEGEEYYTLIWTHGETVSILKAHWKDGANIIELFHSENPNR